MKALFAQKALYSASPILPQAAFPALPARGGAAGRRRDPTPEDSPEPRHTVRLRDRAVGIGQKRKVQSLPFGEARVRLRRVAAHADDCRSRPSKLLRLIPEAAGLLGTGRRIVLGVEVEDERLAAEVLEDKPCPIAARSRE